MRRLFVLGLLILVPIMTCQVVASLSPTSTSAPVSTQVNTPKVEITASSPIPSKLPPKYAPPPKIAATATYIDDAYLDICLARINKILETQPFQPLTEYAGSGANFNLVVYDVKDGQLGEPVLITVPEDYQKYQQDFAAQRRIWDFAAAILPPLDMKWITKFIVFTDGHNNKIAAWVDPDGLDRHKWTLGVDILDSEDPVALATILAHEFGHLITMNSDQITEMEYSYGWNQDPSVCPQFLHRDGCSTPDSYMNLFYQKFWKDIFEEWRKTVYYEDFHTTDDFDIRLDKFFQAHRELFSRKYSATNINEDMADSFSYFILKPKPTGNDVVDQKMLFFYDFPELVQLRQKMIQGICTYQH